MSIACKLSESDRETLKRLIVNWGIAKDWLGATDSSGHSGDRYEKMERRAARALGDFCGVEL